VALGSLLAGCAAKAAPLAPGGVPPLNVPQPPAREVVPPTEKPTLPVVQEPPAVTSDPRPPRPRETPPAPRTAAPPPTEPPVADPPVVATPPPVLSTSADTTDLEKRVRDRLQQARNDLSQINPFALGTDARGQYDSAGRFIRQAEEALKVKNLVYASQLADKAATMAALLRRIA